jgi:hypothetical protein
MRPKETTTAGDHNTLAKMHWSSSPSYGPFARFDDFVARLAAKPVDSDASHVKTGIAENRKILYVISGSKSNRSDSCTLR